VYVFTFAIVWRYRASDNRKAKYTPDWDSHRLLELAWWAIPFIIISVLAVITWRSSHELDPFRALDSAKKPITIQVVALQWKWLFIYPDQHIATLNYVEFPEDTPVNFEITADAPMNSFWIPSLGGQVYAMPGMKTQLHLISDHAGEYQGSSSNISGQGFAGMRFTAKAVAAADFADWAKKAEKSTTALDWIAYSNIAAPSQDLPATDYVLAEHDLFDKVVDKFMLPPDSQMHEMTGMIQ